MKKIQLSIPEPCHQNWDDMTPTQQGRFCNTCAKQVIDFSSMCDSEVLNYFSKVKNETVCGRACPDQLDRNITNAPTKKLVWHWKYMVAFFLFFGKAGKARSQTTGMVLPMPVDTITTEVMVDIASKNPATKKNIISGIVTDESGQPVPFATIKLLQSRRGVSADAYGNFSLIINRLNSTIETSALNYVTKRVMLYDHSYAAIVLAKTNQLMKEVIINSTADYAIKGKMRTGGISVRSCTIKRNIVKDSLQTLLNSCMPAVKIYPNPVVKGNTFIVQLKIKRPDTYTIQITDGAGRIMLERKINTGAKEISEHLQSSSNWGGGMYYLRVMNEKGKCMGTGDLVIQ